MTYLSGAEHARLDGKHVQKRIKFMRKSGIIYVRKRSHNVTDYDGVCDKETSVFFACKKRKKNDYLCVRLARR